MKINWKKGIFSNNYTFYSEGKEIGNLEDKVFSSTSSGLLLDEKLKFITKGFFNPTTNIIDSKTNKVIGNIAYNSLQSKAVATFNTETLVWKYENFWNSKWSFNQRQNKLIAASVSTTEGRVECETDKTVYLLTALFINSYYKRMSIAILIAIFIPIWMASMN